MPGWAWAIIVVAAVVVVALVVWRAFAAKRTRTLQSRFGPEYDRTLETADSRRDAEADLKARADRRDELDIRPLAPGARERYVAEWQQVQARFVDDPDIAVREADVLIQQVMSDRGYPMNDFEQRAADVSVDHPDVVENYREAHRLSRAAATGDATTEDLRQAMQHYRSLFDELLEESASEPVSRDTAATDARAAR
jgi:FtsZ-interacting cell division protein ZipA